MTEVEVKEWEKRTKAMLEGDPQSFRDGRLTVKEVLQTPDASVLIPRVIVDIMRETVEPLFIGTKLLQRIQLTEGRSIEFPQLGALRAHDIPEGANYPEEELDLALLEKPNQIRVAKSGLMVRITDEMISDSQWDVIGWHLRAAARAMARWKEEKVFREFTMHGHIVFDNSLSDPEAHTTGMDFEGNFNQTLGADDMLDLMIALMANGYVPTDLLMHPLVWPMVAKNDLVYSISSTATYIPDQSQPRSIALGPGAVQGRIPFAINIWFSPFIPLDREARLYEIYAVDRNEVGVLLVKEDISVEQFDNPERDIQSLKIKERYGIGVLNEGRAVAVMKNVKLARSFPIPQRVYQVSGGAYAQL